MVVIADEGHCVIGLMVELLRPLRTAKGMELAGLKNLPGIDYIPYLKLRLTFTQSVASGKVTDLVFVLKSGKLSFTEMVLAFNPFERRRYPISEARSKRWPG